MTLSVSLAGAWEVKGDGYGDAIVGANTALVTGTRPAGAGITVTVREEVAVALGGTEYRVRLPEVLKGVPPCRARCQPRADLHGRARLLGLARLYHSR